MKKILITILLCLFATISQADHKDYNFVQAQLPVWCGDPVQIEKYLNDHGYKPLSVSFGRTGADPEGAIVFGAMNYINMETNQLVPIMIAPDSSEACMMYITFNLTFDETTKEEFKEYLK